MAQRPQSRDFQSLVLSCNKDGMESLRKGELSAAFEQFKYAEAILISNQSDGDNTSLLAVTCNNLGCYYKKTGKLHGALSYLRRALKMEVDLDTDEVTLAGTHLNVCAILSKLKKHEKAVQHATWALELISKRIEYAEPSSGASQDDYSVLAIAYHNVAVERDMMREYDLAATAFQQGYQVAKKRLGEDHPLTLTLSQNCDSILQKSKKSRALTSRPPTGGETFRPRILPALASAAKVAAPMPESTIRSEAAGFVSARTAAEATSEARELTLAPLGSVPYSAAKQDWGYALKAQDTQAFKDIIDADCNNHAVTGARIAIYDCRPNRMIKGTTRTARVVRRTGLSNSFTHRELVSSGRGQAASIAYKSAYEKKMAAERIQRVWRAYYAYCQENQDWMAVSRAAATAIQANWRGYHVRRMKFDQAAVRIQKHARGLRVRRILRRHQAAVTIQRHGIGMATRAKLNRMHNAARKIQSLSRGAAGRRRVRALRARKYAAAVALQCCFRRFRARRHVNEVRKAKQLERSRQKGAMDIQRLFRGHMGRKRAAVFRQAHDEKIQLAAAATLLQSKARQLVASKRAEKLREERFAKMNVAATYIRKIWVGYRTRKRYNALIAYLAQHAPKIIVIQRYARGFLVRSRMWREALRAEEELWAAMEIQRVYRGYRGRAAWEAKYESIWRREMAAASLQRLFRGYFARKRVGLMRRRLARAEFERARQRFFAAQRMQALARGVLSRKVTHQMWRRKVDAAVVIQRVWRGVCLRQRLWRQVCELRAVSIQAVARGFLVRRRRLYCVSLALCVQRTWRGWARLPEERKDLCRARRREEREQKARQSNAASTIQVK